MGKTKRAIVLFLLPCLLLPLLFVQSASGQSGILLTKTWGGPFWDEGRGVAVDSSGNIYVTGYTNSFGPGSPQNSSLTLLKYSPTGTLLWQRIWTLSANGDQVGRSVAVDSYGNVYVVGSSSLSPGRGNVLLLKFDPSGNLLWQKTWGGGFVDFGSGITLDSSGNIYLSGSTASGGPTSLVLLMKLDSSGNLLWEKTWGGSGNNSWGQGVALDASSNIYVTGYSYNFGRGVVLLLKFDTSGNLLWQRISGGSNGDFGTSVAVDPSGNAYLTGYTYSFGAGDSDVLLLKVDSSGNLLWQKTWGGSKADLGFGAALDLSGNMYVTGETDSFPAGARELLLLKLDSSGNLLSQNTWGWPSLAYGQGIASDSSGNILIAGSAQGPPYTLSSSGNNTLGTPGFPLSNPGLTLTTPTFTLRTATGTVQTISGSETFTGNYADQLLLRYGQFPTITFKTSPSSGSLSFNGTTYTNGQNGNYSYGTVPISAHPPSGYYVTGWTSSGGITVASPSTNATTATISGSGTLTANFAPVSTPSAPLGLSATGSTGKIVLAWSGPSSTGGLSITGYKVYRGTSPGTETLLTTLGNINTYNDTSASTGIVYYYKVTALNTMGESPSSNEANTSLTSPQSAFPLFFYLPILAILAALAVLVVVGLKRHRKQPGNPTLPG